MPEVSLRPVTAQTVRAICTLKTTAAQRQFVSPNALSIAQAYFEPAARFEAVYAGDEPVGFMMWRPDGESAVYLWRFMIAAGQQGRGYGRAAIALLVKRLTADDVRLLRLGYHDGEGGPGPFYRKLGFTETGATRPSGELVAERTLARNRPD